MPHLTSLLRLGALSLLLAAAVFAGCAGNSVMGPDPNPPDASLPVGPPNPALAGPLELAFPLEYGLGPAPAGRAASDETDFTRLGDEYFDKSVNATSNPGLHQLTLLPASQGFSWGMFQFTSVLDSETPFSLTLGFADAPGGEYWLGIADYATLHWYWVNIIPSGGADALAMPAGVDPTSPLGNLYVAVVMVSPESCVLQSVTLTKNVALPPPQDFTASDGANASAILLDWTDPAVTYPALDYDTIKIERALTAGGPWLELASVPAGETHYEDVWDAADNNYPYDMPIYYRLYTVADGVESVASLIDSGYRVLGNVMNLAATDGTLSDGIQITWNAVGGADGYRLEYALAEFDPPGWMLLAELPVQTSFLHSTTAPPGAEAVEGEFYLYRAKAHYQGSDSANWSNQDQGHFLAVPVAVIEPSVTLGAAPLNVHFSALSSYDPGGGMITKYEWDWEGDGIWDFDSAEDSQADHFFTEFGVYSTTVRVTDDEMQTATASVDIEVPGWLHCWGGPAVEKGAAVALDSAGNVWVCGKATSPGNGEDIVLLKYSSGGIYSDHWIWDNGGADAPTAMRCVGDVLYIAGYTEISGDGHRDALLMEFDTLTGNLANQRVWDSQNGSAFNALAFDESGNLCLAGQVELAGEGTAALVLRLDAAGGVVWAKSWDPLNLAVAHSCVPVGEEVFVTGYYTAGVEDNQLFLIRITGEAADLSLQKQWNGGTVDEGHSMVVDGSSLLLCGVSNILDPAAADGLLLRMDFDGNVEWQKVWGQTDLTESFAALQLQAGTLFCTGSAEYGGAIMLPVLAIMNDGSSLLFQRLFGIGATGNRAAQHLVLDDQFGIYFAGETKNLLGGWEDVFFSFADCAGTVGEANGTYEDAVGTLENLTLDTVDFAGNHDTGSGNEECLVMRYETLLMP